MDIYYLYALLIVHWYCGWWYDINIWLLLK